ncbi:hypothetical protein HNO92_002987 [Chromobacterium alkanivorans]|uniref:enhanced serine sensitivity protein SseB C-terminal domain-containing protein n=1 Tax=Chromobacterium alkanivorans TaxID=1071719 RepID=UPI00216A69AF|nr:enhanced serine sensitivity protein SseB C-terminal domain-containing protein [Chromobacterium alkanivorans]MCS3803751.1 hypothetical protein [Chromobacterium alkanivorans]MCS3818144.1 hypothetical protein [Chromobacterium alkanivorans]MCS3874657.1 hypothetical protein [Chromobacterium alkanivorans]
MKNKLEDLLSRAAVDASLRPDFISLLLQSNVYVIGHVQDDSLVMADNTIPAGSKLAIHHLDFSDGVRRIPFFTSLNSLQRSIGEEVQYMLIPAKSFFEITLGAELVLNPGLEYGKGFTPQEVESIIRYGYAGRIHSEEVESSRKVLLGVPSHYPDKMIEALNRFFIKRPAVREARLGWMHDPVRNSKPAYLVGVVIKSDDRKLVSEIGHVASDTVPAGEFVDIVLMKGREDGVSRFLLDEVEPFYRQSFLLKVKSFLFGWQK